MRLFLMVALVCCAIVAKAQFTDSTTHYARLGLTGNLNRSNNATAYLLNNEARFSVRNRRRSLNSAVSWLYGEQGSLLTNNDVAATVDFNRFLDSSNFYFWGLGNYISSFSLKIRSQGQAGAGVAYNVLNTPAAWLNLSEGLLYEVSRLATADPSINKYQTTRHSARMSYRFVLRGGVIFTGSNFFQQSLTDGADYSLRLTNGVAIKLNKWIAANAAVSFNQFKRTGTQNLLFTYGVVAEGFF